MKLGVCPHPDCGELVRGGGRCERHNRRTATEDGGFGRVSPHLTVCAVSGCPNLTESNFCEQHRLEDVEAETELRVLGRKLESLIGLVERLEAEEPGSIELLEAVAEKAAVRARLDELLGKANEDG